MITVPKCSCSERSVGDSVFTCPECIRAALRAMDGERVDQHELFAHVDSTGSVSVMDEDEDGLVPINAILPVVLDGLPF